MADRPIIFSDPMVRALLDGRKSQTRRVLRPQPHQNSAGLWVANFGRRGFFQTTADQVAWSFLARGALPYAPGDRLWVREAWATVNSDYGPGWAYRANSDFIEPEYDGEDFGAGPSFNYRKYPGEYSMWFDDLLSGVPGHCWKSPIHMPRWASRLTLVVTDVRVQRLQEISEADAAAEGVDAVTMADVPRQAAMSRRSDFAALWNSLHGPEAWASNPWVAAISFETHRTNIDALGAADAA